MANEVFANDLEIACKKADGKSIACFPDPCFSPPSPSAGWILIPYANTAYAKDTTNASKTVFISGKPIMKKDVSYFKTSTGNEPAAGPKGQFTGVKKGKAYFTSWSMNVKVEGKNVDRHTDGMTHNHGSVSGNTGIWTYIDKKFWGGDCKRELLRVEKACGGLVKKPRRRGGPTLTNNKNYKPGEWKDKHCKFLNFTPSEGLKGVETPKKLLAELKEKIANADAMKHVVEAAKEEAMSIAFNAGAKLVAKGVATKLVPIAGWIYSGLTLAEDIAEADYYVEMYDGAINESNRIINDVENIKADIEDAIGPLQDAEKSIDKAKVVQNKLANWQRSAATIDPCLRARKCMLVPYKDSRLKAQTKNTGCCAGQTGHHLIPDSFIKNAGCTVQDPKNKNGEIPYNSDNAPVVCAEGTRAHHEIGSHGAIHTATTEMLVDEGNYGSTREAPKSLDDVMNGVVKAHAKTFPFSTCSRKCIKSQLEKYYKKCDKDLSVKKIGTDPSKVKGKVNTGSTR